MKSLQFILAGIAAITLALVAYAAKAQGLNLRGSPTPGTPIMYWHLNLGRLNNTGPNEPMQEVIRDAEEFNRFWRRLYSTHRYEDYLRAPKPPNIDFSKEIVIALALGAKSTGGYAIRADSVVQGSGQIEVAVTRTLLGQGCAGTTSFTWPVDIIRMEVRDVPIVFLTREVKEDCK